jgi:hypothetical protein
LADNDQNDRLEELQEQERLYAELQAQNEDWEAGQQDPNNSQYDNSAAPQAAASVPEIDADEEQESGLQSTVQSPSAKAEQTMQTAMDALTAAMLFPLAAASIVRPGNDPSTGPDNDQESNFDYQQKIAAEHEKAHDMFTYDGSSRQVRNQMGKDAQGDTSFVNSFTGTNIRSSHGLSGNDEERANFRFQLYSAISNQIQSITNQMQELYEMRARLEQKEREIAEQQARVDEAAAEAERLAKEVADKKEELDIATADRDQKQIERDQAQADVTQKDKDFEVAAQGHTITAEDGTVISELKLNGRHIVGSKNDGETVTLTQAQIAALPPGILKHYEEKLVKLDALDAKERELAQAEEKVVTLEDQYKALKDKLDLAQDKLLKEEAKLNEMKVDRQELAEQIAAKERAIEAEIKNSNIPDEQKEALRTQLREEQGLDELQNKLSNLNSDISAQNVSIMASAADMNTTIYNASVASDMISKGYKDGEALDLYRAKTESSDNRVSTDVADYTSKLAPLNEQLTSLEAKLSIKESSILDAKDNEILIERDGQSYSVKYDPATSQNGDYLGIDENGNEFQLTDAEQASAEAQWMEFKYSSDEITSLEQEYAELKGQYEEAQQSLSTLQEEYKYFANSGIDLTNADFNNDDTYSSYSFIQDDGTRKEFTYNDGWIDTGYSCEIDPNNPPDFTLEPLVITQLEQEGPIESPDMPTVELEEIDLSTIPERMPEPTYTEAIVDGVMTIERDGKTLMIAEDENGDYVAIDADGNVSELSTWEYISVTGDDLTGGKTFNELNNGMTFEQYKSMAQTMEKYATSRTTSYSGEDGGAIQTDTKLTEEYNTASSGETTDTATESAPTQELYTQNTASGPAPG